MEVAMMRCVYWIPAFAGMTVVPSGLCRADFIPAFAGMTVVPSGLCRADFIPAFAGMTVVPSGLCRADFIPAFAGMTEKNGAIVPTGPKFPARQRGQDT